VLPSEVDAAVRLVYHRGRYHMHYSVKVEVSDQQPVAVTDKPLHRVLAIDPGVRTMSTCYDVDGAVYEWGIGTANNLTKMLQRADKIAAKHSRVVNNCRPPCEFESREACELHNKRERNRTKCRRRRLYREHMAALSKVRNHVSELHNKQAAWMCQN